MSSIKFGIVMDPPASLIVDHDSSVAMAAEAQLRGWSVDYIQARDLGFRDGEPVAHARPVKVLNREKQPWCELGEEHPVHLAEYAAIMMRRDPPFDLTYLYATHILDLAAQKGVLVVNRPQSLRDQNEKLNIARFPQCTAPTIVASRLADIRAFAREQQKVVIKPLDAMGGRSIFALSHDDPNFAVAVTTLTADGATPIMVQRYLPQISEFGDKRIMLIDGKPVPYLLARFPTKGETRANLAAGGRFEVVPLTERDEWICAQVGPFLQQTGQWFVGLDVIGGYLTEINVTSPTGAREIDRARNLNIVGDFIEVVAGRLLVR